MDILIKGMEMPKACFYCPMRLKVDPDDIKCIVTGDVFEETYAGTIETRNRGNCPLVPVPPHGRLIDADALMQEFEKAQRTMEQRGREYSCSFMSSGQELSTEWYCVEDMVENAPTIIPADKEAGK